VFTPHLGREPGCLYWGIPSVSSITPCKC